MVLDEPVSKSDILFVKGTKKWKYTHNLTMHKKGWSEKKEKARKNGMGFTL